MQMHRIIDVFVTFRLFTAKPLGSLARPRLAHYPENDTAPDCNDTRIHVSQNETERRPFMKSKSGRVQARHLPGVSLAAVLLLSSSALAGPPFVTDDPEPVDYLHWELYTFSMGMHAMAETDGVAPSCDCNYGGLPNVQLHFQPGMAVHEARGGPLEWGPGDRNFA
jgi:hypothetical protein